LSVPLAGRYFSRIEATADENRGVFAKLTEFIVWILPTNLSGALLLITAIVAGPINPRTSPYNRV
jgi:hypothetical protein